MEFNFNKRFMAIARVNLAVILSIVMLLATSAQASKGGEIAVLYPEVREPYIRIFRDIIAGITQTIPDSVEQYGIPKDANAEEIISRLDKAGVKSVIMLGSRAQKLSPSMAKDKTVLTGAVFSSPTDKPLQSSSISLIAAPDVLLNKLFTLAPQIKTVHVVYNKQKDGWIIAQAEQILKEKGITLNALPSKNVRSNAQVYNDLFKSNSLSNKDAVWLLQSDKSVREPRVFAAILENAWKKRFVVFSANPTHVHKGALFAMYPDNKQLGVSLARKILALQNGGDHSIDPLSDLLVAVNIRTAEHLELDISRSERKSFNMVFPSR